MAPNLPSLFLLSFLLTIVTPAAISGGGLSLDLIHCLPTNLTKSQLAQRLIQQSRSRIFDIKQSILESRLNTTTIRPPVVQRNLLYLVSVTIGTSQGLHSYYLVMDTGSGLTWTQCISCDPCFPQTEPKFDPARSPSFNLLDRDDPLCVPPYHQLEHGCNYMVTYGDGSEVQGVFSRETFTFHSSTGQPESFPSLPFGCTTSSYGQIGYTGDPAGILGLDASPESFITQLHDHTGGRFSYCLNPYDVTAPSYLRFGNDIAMTGPVQRTPFVVREGFYDVVLNDISVNGQRLNLPQGTFSPRPDGGGGCIIDSGTGITHLTVQAYRAVKGAVERHFSPFNLERAYGRDYGMDVEICYKKPSSFNSFPSMTFHFDGADMQIGWEELFVVDTQGGETVFCFLMVRDDWMTMIGAYQQFNTRFTFDVINREVLFVPQNCAENA